MAAKHREKQKQAEQTTGHFHIQNRLEMNKISGDYLMIIFLHTTI